MACPGGSTHGREHGQEQPQLSRAAALSGMHAEHGQSTCGQSMDRAEPLISDRELTFQASNPVMPIYKIVHVVI